MEGNQLTPSLITSSMSELEKDSVALSGEPFHPVPTGRRDSVRSYPEIAKMELPAPDDDLSAILLKFFTRNFHRTRNTRSFGCVQSELVVWCTAGGGS
ncbi:hypothetical protein MKW98_024380 [Papaver atlanticum]|uniref:Plant heme peroxidase family profile domain-containing protein n=1 Tax=Papaver atlanticum TaxID=357466 RepID=A0AAD4T0K7_9MAGN|nr:hypothetical protein MKW98_024380 [Papaver atlanticum]